MAHSISAATGKGKKNDELYTPQILVEPINKYLQLWARKYKIYPTVLCPFDNKKSEFVKLLKNWNVKVKYGHIESGQDFFTHDYGEWDICISNPPFSKKLEVFKKLDEIGKPWAMICNVMMWNYHEIVDYFIDNEPELLFFNKRVSFDGNPSSFGSHYICRNLLPRKLICESLENNNAGKYFVPSGMYTK